MTRLSWKRQFTSIILILSFSCAALGGGSPGVSGAVLHASGIVQVNGVGSREITTLFSGDSIQTTEDSVANIVADGSSVLVLPNALVKFMGQGVELTEGGVSVATSGGMMVSSYGLTFTAPEHTQSKFEVVEYEDSVTVAARQGNVIVTDGRQTSTVPEGQESTHKKRRAAGAAPAAGGTHSMSGTTLALLGGASGATVAGILIAASNKKKKCISASNNKKCKCKKDKNGKEDCEEED